MSVAQGLCGWWRSRVGLRSGRAPLKERIPVRMLHIGRRDDRLDWMYGSGLQAKQDADKRREDMLLGKAEVALPPEKQAQEVSRVRRTGDGSGTRNPLMY